jgi:hypothetical protein
MTSSEAAITIKDKIIPQLSELGLEAFVLSGYVKCEGDTVERLVIVNGGNNVAYQDGMGPLIAMAAGWGKQQLKVDPSG